MATVSKSKIVILDFGSQYTLLIARRVRECNVYCEVLPYNTPFAKIKNGDPGGIILSGGPGGVYEKDTPFCDKKIFGLGVPVLGICYGMQLIAHFNNGKVLHSGKREYGKSCLHINDGSPLFKDIKKSSTVWMSHGDRLESLPKHFKIIAHTSNAPVAAMENSKAKIFGIQFHPEVTHTAQGKKILSNFVNIICDCVPSWTMKSFLDNSLERIRKETNGKQIVCAVSGGVDSTVVAVLVNKAIGKNLNCIFVNNGLLRKNEFKKVMSMFKHDLKLNVNGVNASESFLKKLSGVFSPERKRKIIGREFIAVFDKEAKKLGEVNYLAQGTLYPDVIESVSFSGGPSAKIKSHHNVGGLPKKMKLKLIEPLRLLFKDEVRLLGKELGIPDHVLNRHPFPGPGLAIRTIGKITKKRLKILREADNIFIEEIEKAGLYDSIWQAFAVLLPVKTVGVMGDKRTYENVLAIRAVSSVDGMTADWVRLPSSLLEVVSNRVINEIKGINRVVYDISSKPPGTIEWE